MEVLGFQFQPKKVVVEYGQNQQNKNSSKDPKPQKIDRLEDPILSWCKCGNCSIMTGYGAFLEEEECLCCHEVVKVADPYYKLEGN